jgi:hypothetical protein
VSTALEILLAFAALVVPLALVGVVLELLARRGHTFRDDAPARSRPAAPDPRRRSQG